MNTIVYIMDEGYSIPTSVSICSVIENAKSDESYCFFVICNKVSDSTKSIFNNIDIKSNKLEFYDIPKEIETQINNVASSNLCKKGISANNTALLKFWIEDILNDRDKVLYLDGDIIVNGSLESLFKIDVSGLCVAVSKDMPAQDNTEEFIFREKVLNCKDYFNSGVMLMNLKKMRELNIKDKLISYRKNKENHLMDQDALNAVLNNTKLIISSEYNLMVSYIFPYSLREMENTFKTGYFETLNELVNSAVILHMVCKPWSIYHPVYSKIYDNYYKISPYKKVEQIRSVLVPYDGFKQSDKVIIYGAGFIGNFVYHSIMESKYGQIVLWVDKDAKDKNDNRISSVEGIKNVDYDYIIISILNDKVRMEIRNILIEKYNVEENKLLEYGESK